MKLRDLVLSIQFFLETFFFFLVAIFAYFPMRIIESRIEKRELAEESKEKMLYEDN